LFRHGRRYGYRFLRPITISASWRSSAQPLRIRFFYAFLICVSGCGVSPAHQMRVGCANQLRKHGFTELQVQELVATRLAVEGFLRGGQGR